MILELQSKRATLNESIVQATAICIIYFSGISVYYIPYNERTQHVHEHTAVE